MTIGRISGNVVDMLNTAEYRFDSPADARDATRAIDWSELVVRNWGLFLRICAAELRGWGSVDVEDCAQDAILRVLEVAPKGFRFRANRRNASPDNWAGVVVRNHARNWRKRACRSKPHSSAWVDGIASDLHDSLTPAIHAAIPTCPYAALERRSERERLQVAIATLDKRERLAVETVAAGGNGNAVARKLRASAPTASRVRKSAAAKLAAALAA